MQKMPTTKEIEKDVNVYEIKKIPSIFNKSLEVMVMLPKCKRNDDDCLKKEAERKEHLRKLAGKFNSDHHLLNLDHLEISSITYSYVKDYFLLKYNIMIDPHDAMSILIYLKTGEII